MKRLILLILLAPLALLLAGCPSLGAMSYQGLSPEVAAIAAKDNKAVFQCNDIEAPSIGGGTLKSKSRTMAVDSGTVRYGRFESKSCDDITFHNDNKPPVQPLPLAPTRLTP